MVCMPASVRPGASSTCTNTLALVISTHKLTKLLLVQAVLQEHTFKSCTREVEAVPGGREGCTSMRGRKMKKNATPGNAVAEHEGEICRLRLSELVGEQHTLFTTCDATRPIFLSDLMLVANQSIH
jgi:hypothetical protein